MRITRRRATGDDPSGGSKQTIYAITDLTPEQAGPAELGQIVRDHWAVEALHHIRDVTYTEDASRVRTRSTPRVMAALRNLAISQLKLLGWDNIAEANRHLAAHRPPPRHPQPARSHTMRTHEPWSLALGTLLSRFQAWPSSSLRKIGNPARPNCWKVASKVPACPVASR
jgi:hypothetical protein